MMYSFVFFPQDTAAMANAGGREEGCCCLEEGRREGGREGRKEGGEGGKIPKETICLVRKERVER